MSPEPEPTQKSNRTKMLRLSGFVFVSVLILGGIYFFNNQSAVLPSNTKDQTNIKNPTRSILTSAEILATLPSPVASTSAYKHVSASLPSQPKQTTKATSLSAFQEMSSSLPSPK